MGIEAAVYALSQLNLRNKIRDDDFVDIMNHVVTPGILLLAATATYLTQWMGEPIHCWTPAEYNGHFQDYVDSFCWITEMYNVPMDEELPKIEEDRDENLVGFYRWVSVLLLLQALMFKLPHVLWMSWKGVSGMDPDRIIKMAEEGDMDEQILYDDDDDVEPIVEGAGSVVKPVQKAPKEPKESKIEPLVHFIDRRLRFTARRKEDNPCSKVDILNKSSGSFLTYFYLIVKCLYPFIIILQFVLLSEFLNINFFTYGIDIAVKQTDWSFWEDEAVFPRIAMCDFNIRQLQNVQTFTVQCVLAMNMFIEKIYLLLWIWMYFLLVITVIGTIQSFLDKILFSRHQIFIKKFLSIGQYVDHFWPPRKPKYQPARDKKFQRPKEIFQYLSSKEKDRIAALIQQDSFQRMFIEDYLQADGIFILKCIHRNTSNMAVIDIIFRLLEHFMVEKRLVHVDDDDDDIYV
ncbi:innexin unc-9 [Patella vulgata]|uniref:innexin unc-9 n=1 Tax=Patella vulgata TaxID=6465 RepID=UPI0021804CCD|nr:innexin unc-9 [Patella vulgata]